MPIFDPYRSRAQPNALMRAFGLQNPDFGGDPWSNLGRPPQSQMPGRDRFYRSPSRQAAPPVNPAPAGQGFPTLIEALTKGIGGFAQWAAPKLQQKSLEEQLLELMQGMIGGGGSVPSLGDYESQARAEAAAEYDPQLAAIQSAMARARRDTERNKGGIESLYDALAASYPADIRATKETFKEARRGERGVHEQAQEGITGGYEEATGNLANVMQQLGLEAAAPDVLPGVAADEAEALKYEAERTAAEQSAYNRQATGERAYYDQGPELAAMGSAEGQSALTHQLQNFLLDQRAQQAQLESQKALTYNALLGKYRTEGAESAAQAQNTQFSQMGQLLNAILAVKRFQMQGMGAGQEPNYSGATGAANILGEQAGLSRGTELNQGLNDFLANELGTQPSKPDYFQAVNLLRQYAEEQGYSSADVNALVQALSAYYDMYR